jgi:hypothetical protein
MSHRNALAAAVEAHNHAHPTARLPRPAARLLAVMFAIEDVCCVSRFCQLSRLLVRRHAVEPG